MTAVAAAFLTLAGCGDGDDAAGCSPAREEPLDPASATGHVLPGAPEPRYLTDPPTSGPHQSGAPPTGRLRQPLSRPAQVSLLEHGEVLLQHRDLSADDRADLESLVGENVTVAPNPDLPAPVVATAWTFSMRCERVDVATLRDFIREHRGHGAPHQSVSSSLASLRSDEPAAPSCVGFGP